jgi:hypothetical protein
MNRMDRMKAVIESPRDCRKLPNRPSFILSNPVLSCRPFLEKGSTGMNRMGRMDRMKAAIESPPRLSEAPISRDESLEER